MNHSFDVNIKSVGFDKIRVNADIYAI